MKTAVIGVGNMGKHHARIYSHLKGSDLVGVADINQTLGKETADLYGCKLYTDYNELIENERPDIISVCIPTSLHHKVAIDCIKAGVNTLIEKPIATTIKEAEEIVALAKQKNVKLMVGHIERFNPAVQKLKEVIKSGQLGNVISILARRVGIFPPKIKDVNVVVDLAVHDIDIFNYLLEKEPTEIFSSAGKAILDSKEDYADIFLKYNNGVNGLIEVNWVTPVKIRFLNVTGTKGYAELNYITQDLTVYGTEYEKTHDEFGDFLLKFGDPKKIEISVTKSEPLKLELEHFISCVKNNTHPLFTGEDAISALDIALKITKQPLQN